MDLRADISKQVRNEFPDASVETLNAIVTRRIYEKSLMAAIPEDKELTLKPNMVPYGDFLPNTSLGCIKMMRFLMKMTLIMILFEILIV